MPNNDTLDAIIYSLRLMVGPPSLEDSIRNVRAARAEHQRLLDEAAAADTAARLYAGKLEGAEEWLARIRTLRQEVAQRCADEDTEVWDSVWDALFQADVAIREAKRG